MALGSNPPPPPPPPPRPQGAPAGNDDPLNQFQQSEHNSEEAISYQQQIPHIEEEDECDDDNDEDYIEEEEEEIMQIFEPQILNIRSTILVPAGTCTNNTIIKILITNEMSNDDLSHCIAHAALSSPESAKLLQSWSSSPSEPTGTARSTSSLQVTGSNYCDWDWTRISGLFRERDEVFVPLRLILQNPMIIQNEVFRISRLPSHSNRLQRKTSNSKYSFSLIHMLLFGVCSAIVLNMNLSTVMEGKEYIIEGTEYIAESVTKLPTLITETCIEYPLKEMYRYGPSIVGWEGSTLANICTQVTHMGDESFWNRNIEECIKIYENKEVAMLHVRRPVVYIALAYISFLITQSLVKTWAIRKQNRPHREMVETYEAFRLLSKLIQRGMTPRKNPNY